jgi:protein O-GlcNAc transferase
MTNPDTPPDGLDLDDVLFEQAVAAHESGRLDEAERLYREVLRREPEDSAVHELLGQILVARGSIDGAIKHLRRSVSIDPGSQGAWTALAMALESAGDWTEALEAVDRGLQLGPGDVVARVTRVLLMSRCGDPRVALMEMASILEEPTLSVTHARLLAKVARAASDPQLLWRAMERIDRLDDREFDDVHAIARAEWQSGRLDRVEVCLRRLHEERPAHSEVALNLAGLLANSGRARQGVEVLRRSLEGAPQDAKLRMLLASLLDRVGEVEEAQRARSAGGMDSFPMLFAEAAGCLREGYQSAEEINASRDRLETLIQRASDALSLDSETDRLAAMEAAMQVSFFKLPAQGLPDRSVSESIAEILSRIVASVRPEAVAAPPVGRRGTDGRIRVGVLSGFFRTHSNWKSHLAGLAGLDRRRFEVTALSTDPTADEVTVQARASYERFVDAARNPLEVIDLVRGEQLQVLIIPEVGMDPRTRFAAVTRLAPIQWASWGHCTTTGHRSMNGYLSSVLMEPENGDEHYVEPLIRLPGLGQQMEPPPGGVAAASQLELGLSDGEVAIWCAHAAFTHLPQYDELYARIAEQCPEARFFFVNRESELFRRRLEATFSRRGLSPDRSLRFLPRLSQQRFLGLNAACDLYLDTPEWSGCNTGLETILMDCPPITLPGRFLRGRHLLAFLRMMEMTDLVAADLDAYVELAVSMVREPDRRAEARRRLAERRGVLWRNPAPRIALEDLIEREVAAIEQTGSDR